MQAYEHILAALIGLSKDGKKRGLTLDENLQMMRKYAAYITYPDSIRPLVKGTEGKPYRQPSHFTDGAWMEFITGTELKELNDRYPSDKILYQMV